MAGRLQDKVAVVTGGANGIGRACCVRFAEEGADVVVADLDAEQGEETVRLVREAGRDARFIRTDTTSEADCLAMVQVAVDAFGGVDVCLAAAGIGFGGYVSGQTWRREGSPADWYITRQTLDSWQTVLDVNLTGVMLTDRAVAQPDDRAGPRRFDHQHRLDLRQERARGQLAYAVSKAGVWMLTKVAALELVQDRIRVNAIGPGYVETNMTLPAQEDEEVNRTLLADVPMGRLGQPREIADAALFLACDESSYFTGEMLHPDGGYFTE